MKHLMGYLAIAAAAALLVAAPGGAADDPTAQAVSANAAAAARPDTNAGRVPAMPRSNLDPLRGPVVSNPHALPREALDWQSDAPHQTWRGYTAN